MHTQRPVKAQKAAVAKTVYCYDSRVLTEEQIGNICKYFGVKRPEEVRFIRNRENSSSFSSVDGLHFFSVADEKNIIPVGELAPETVDAPEVIVETVSVSDLRKAMRS